MRKVARNITLDPGLLNRIKARAEIQDRSVSWVVNELCELGFLFEQLRIERLEKVGMSDGRYAED